MKSLPGMFSLLAFGTKRILTRQDISNLSRLTSHQVVGLGVVFSPLTSNFGKTWEKEPRYLVPWRVKKDRPKTQ